MATVGIVGGLGPESTIDYYRRIIKAWQQEDPSTSPSLVIDSLDAQRALQLVASDRQALTDYLLASIERLTNAGAGFAVLSANTAHVVFDGLSARARIPLVSIVETCAAEAQRLGLHRPALLGTRFTMEEAFYPMVFGRAGIDVVTPNAGERVWVHERYVSELLKGDFRGETREHFITLVDRLRRDEHIDGVILGGTELPLLLHGDRIAGVRVLDTTALHVAAIVQRLLAA
jgi:aspartate racemase